MNFISALIEGTLNDDNKEEYRRQILEIEKQLESVLNADNDNKKE